MHVLGRTPAFSLSPAGDASAIQSRVAMAVAAKVLDSERAAGVALVALLDPSVGQRLDLRG